VEGGASGGNRCEDEVRGTRGRLGQFAMHDSIHFFSAFKGIIFSSRQLKTQATSRLPRAWFCRGQWRCSFNKQTSLSSNKQTPLSNTNSNPRPWPGLQWSLCTCRCDSMGFHHLRQYLPRKVAAWLDGGWSLVWCQKPMLDETERSVAGSRKSQRVRIARARGTILGKIARAPIHTQNKESE
jgi:hypothetical protein